MNKKVIFGGIFLLSNLVYSQIGINTQNPKATLDVAAMPENLEQADGFIAPRLKGSELKAKESNYTSDQIGAIVYVTEALSLVNATGKTVNVTNIGYYYFDGTIWKQLYSTEPWYSVNTGRPATLNTENIYHNGRALVGFSLTNPTSWWDTYFATLNVRGAFSVQSFGTPAIHSVIRYNGTETSPTAVRINEDIGRLRFQGYDGSTRQDQADIKAIASTNFTSTNKGGAHLAFLTQSGSEVSATNSFTEKMRITDLGNVGIGLTNPVGKLHVNGSIVLTGTEQQHVSIVNSTTAGVSAIYSTSANSSQAYPFNQSGNLIIQPWSSPTTTQRRDVIFMNNSTNDITMIVSSANKVSIGSDLPKEKLDVAGAVKLSSPSGYDSPITDGATTPIPTGGAGTIIFQNDHFFGFDGTSWKQLDN